MKIEWTFNEYGWRAAPEHDVTLYVTPDRYKFGKPARGAKWRAGASRWTESTRTVSRFGRDIYSQLFDTRQEAMRAAEQIYNETKKGN